MAQLLDEATTHPGSNRQIPIDKKKHRNSSTVYYGSRSPCLDPCRSVTAPLRQAHLNSQLVPRSVYRSQNQACRQLVSYRPSSQLELEHQREVKDAKLAHQQPGLVGRSPQAERLGHPAMQRDLHCLDGRRRTCLRDMVVRHAAMIRTGEVGEIPTKLDLPWPS